MPGTTLIPSRPALPDIGIPAAEIQRMMDDASSSDVEWELGRVAALVYLAGDDVSQVAKDAYLGAFSTNGLAPSAFPSLRRYESDVIGMVSGLLNAQGAIGAITSGGTESILLAVLIARDRARQLQPHIKTPTMVLPETAHPAFNKAGHFFDVEPIRVPTGEGFRVDVDRYEASVTDDTILCIGSAPNYVYTMIDPIPELSEIARARDISFHVDACVGGFFLPFVEKLGYRRIPFDFRNPGVTTMSADLHKFGYTAKGASTLICRDEEIGNYMGFHFSDWPGGSYRTPTLMGTRPGGAIAAAWAVMNYLGEEGYLKRTKQTMDFIEHFIESIEAVPELYIVGEPDMSLVAFGSHSLDMVAIGDAMQARGWWVYLERVPPSIHLMLSPGHAPFMDQYLGDLMEVVDLARAGKIERKRTEIKYGQ